MLANAERSQTMYGAVIPGAYYWSQSGGGLNSIWVCVNLGQTAMCAAMMAYVCSLDWEKQAELARQRSLAAARR